MKANICDPCLKEGKVVLSGWSIKHRGAGSVSIALCREHRNQKWGKDFSREEFFKVAIEAEGAYNELVRGPLPKGKLTQADPPKAKSALETNNETLRQWQKEGKL